MAENRIVAINRTIGNFTKFENTEFPLDCEGLAEMQVNDALLSVLGNLGGNQYILTGCEKADDGTWSAGYIFTATTAFPAGELLYVESDQGDKIYIQTDSETITASDFTYSGAYSKRYCKHGTSGETFDLSVFTKIQTNISLASDLATLTDTVNSINPEIVGTIKLWPSNTVPSEAWEFCQGKVLNKTAYPEIFAVIGNTFIPSGTTLNDGEFMLPDFRGYIPIGRTTDSNDGYSSLGYRDGSRAHTLTVDQMPRHKHALDKNLQFHVAIAGNSGDTIVGTEPLDGTTNYPAQLGGYSIAAGMDGLGTTYGDHAEITVGMLYNSNPNAGNWPQLAQEKYIGGGSSHNNMQPSMAINYIIKVKSK